MFVSFNQFSTAFFTLFFYASISRLFSFCTTLRTGSDRLDLEQDQNWSITPRYKVLEPENSLLMKKSIDSYEWKIVCFKYYLLKISTFKISALLIGKKNIFYSLFMHIFDKDLNLIEPKYFICWSLPYSLAKTVT